MNIYYNYLLPNGDRTSCSKEITVSQQLSKRHKETTCSTNDVSISFSSDLRGMKVIIVRPRCYNNKYNNLCFSTRRCFSEFRTISGCLQKTVSSGLLLMLLTMFQSSHCLPFDCGTRKLFLSF